MLVISGQRKRSNHTLIDPSQINWGEIGEKSPIREITNYQDFFKFSSCIALYADIELPKGIKADIDCYSSEEVKMIIQRFYDSESNYYGTLIEFIALTSCRPEEAIALTANDIKTKGDRSYIKFSKAYSNRVLLPHTKNRF